MTERTRKYENMPEESITLNGVDFFCIPKAFMVSKNAPPHIKRMIERNAFMPINARWWLYVENLNRGEVAKAALGNKNYDMAVPQPWRDIPEISKKYKAGDWAVWYYAPRDSFGTPIWASHMWKIIKAALAKKLPPAHKVMERTRK